MSELLDKQVNAQKEKIFRGSRKLPQAHEKVCDENESKIRIRKKRCACKSIIHGRKPFIMPKQKTGETDLHEPRGDDYGYNKGTICLVRGLISGKGMVFQAWAHKQTPLNSHWPVLRIGGADFLHYCVTGITIVADTEQ